MRGPGASPGVLAIGCGIVLWLGMAAQGKAAAAQTSAPCEMCHDQVSEWMAKDTVHAPVEAMECTACHNPHASRHASLVRRSGKRICLGCHDGVAEALQTGQAHGAVESEQACLACHDPHASDRAKLLLSGKQELCEGCHDEILQAPAVSHPHPPVVRGECRSCHDPHASPRAHLASRPEPELCTKCHALSGPAMAAAHRNATIARSRCSSCHAPHGSDQAGMIRSAAHPPFEEGMCDACHEDGALLEAPSAAQVNELCLMCHEPRRTGHPIPDGVSCTKCHTPHAASGPGLMRGYEKEICLSCHTEIAALRVGSASYHPAFGVSQDCTVCHRLHTGSTGALLKKVDARRTCMACHSAHAEFAHPMGEGVPDRSRPGHSVGCLSCHDPHGTSFPVFLVADPQQALCLRCHTTGQ